MTLSKTVDISKKIVQHETTNKYDNQILIDYVQVFEEDFFVLLINSINTKTCRWDYVFTVSYC